MQNQSNTDDVKDSGSVDFFTPKKKRLIAILVFLIVWGSCAALFFSYFPKPQNSAFNAPVQVEITKKETGANAELDKKRISLSEASRQQLALLEKEITEAHEETREARLRNSDTRRKRIAALNDRKEILRRQNVMRDEVATKIKERESLKADENDK